MHVSRSLRGSDQGVGEDGVESVSMGAQFLRPDMTQSWIFEFARS